MQKIEITDQRGDYDEPDEVVAERLAQYCGGRRKLTETETVEATRHFRELFEQLKSDFAEFIAALTARPISGSHLNGAAMNLIRGYIGFVGLLVSIIGFMILAQAWWDGTDPFIGWVVTGLGVIMWLQCLPMLRREEERKRHHIYNERET